MNVAFVIGYLLLAPLIGGLLDGADRMISARMQRRRGPLFFLLPMAAPLRCSIGQNGLQS